MVVLWLDDHPLGFAAVFGEWSTVWPAAKAFGVVFLVAFVRSMLTAPYKAYREEVRVRVRVGVEHEKEEIQEAKEKVQKELNDMRVPELRLALDQGGFGAGYIHDDDGAARFSFFFVFTLSSHRAESIADNWRAFVRVPGSDARIPMAIEYHPATTVKRAFPNMPDLELTDAERLPTARSEVVGELLEARGGDEEPLRQTNDLLALVKESQHSVEDLLLGADRGADLSG